MSGVLHTRLFPLQIGPFLQRYMKQEERWCHRTPAKINTGGGSQRLLGSGYGSHLLSYDFC